MIKGFVFDMDGVIFDTENLAVEAWCFAWSQLGMDITKDLVKKTIGLDIENTCRFFAQHINTKVDWALVRKLRLDHTIQYIETNGMPLKPGLFELIDFLKTNGYQIGVATSTESKRATNYLEKAKLTRYFNAIVCGDMVQQVKPDPTIYLTACGQLGLAPAECIALEDSPAGIQSAYSAGLKVILIPDLITPDDQTKIMLYAEVPDLHHIIDLVRNME